MDEATQKLHIARAGRGERRAGSEEQQTLEDAVIENVKQRGRQRERGGGRHVVRRKGERETEPNEDDADILHRVVGEQALEVVLHQCAEHAERAGDPGKGDHDHTPPPRGRAIEVKDDADEAIDGDLGHHAAHQRRYMARRRRMGERKPDVQRNEPRLRAGADEHQDQNQTGECHGCAAHFGKCISTASAGE